MVKKIYKLQPKQIVIKQCKYIKNKLSKISIFSKKEIDNNLSNSQLKMFQKFFSNVPLIFHRNFVVFDWKPVNFADYQQHSNHYTQRPKEKMAIIIQGKIETNYNFTLETVKLYHFLHPDCQIIISTWDDENEQILKEMQECGAVIVTSSVPPRDILKNTLFQNMNCQIKSSFEGLKKAKELGADYAIKTRTDQRLYETNLQEYLINLLEIFPLKTTVKRQKYRLVSCSYDTFKYRLYNVSDMFLFGHIDDMLNYWGCVFETRDLLPVFNNLIDYGKVLPAETYFLVNYLQKIGHKVQFTLQDNWEVLVNYFCIIDENSLGFYWPKHNNFSNRWRHFSKDCRELEKLTFKEWFLLYCGYRPQTNFTPLMKYPFFSEKPKKVYLSVDKTTKGVLELLEISDLKITFSNPEQAFLSIIEINKDNVIKQLPLIKHLSKDKLIMLIVSGIKDKSSLLPINDNIMIVEKGKNLEELARNISAYKVLLRRNNTDSFFKPLRNSKQKLLRFFIAFIPNSKLRKKLRKKI